MYSVAYHLCLSFVLADMGTVRWRRLPVEQLFVLYAFVFLNFEFLISA